MSQDIKNRYSDTELQEFKDLINKKLDRARNDFNSLREQIESSSDELAESKSTGLDDGAGTLEKESLNKMASRLGKYIKHLDNAVIRIENKTYGICRETGKLIRKERLMAVPHATLSIEAKQAQLK